MIPAPPLRDWRLFPVNTGVGLVAAGTVARPWVKFSPKGGESLALVADAAMKRGEHRRAAELYREAIEQHGDFARHWHDLGVAHDRLDRALVGAGWSAEAKNALQRAVELDDDPRYHDLLRRIERGKSPERTGDGTASRRRSAGVFA